MPLEELLAIYRYEASVSTAAGSSMDSFSGELTDELPDMTLDKVNKIHSNIFRFGKGNIVTVYCRANL